MPRITAPLNGRFVAQIDYTAFEDVVSDLHIHCPVTGMDLTDLVAYSSTAWEQAWDAAERHLLSGPVNRKYAADARSLTYDTPYRN